MSAGAQRDPLFAAVCDRLPASLLADRAGLGEALTVGCGAGVGDALGDGPGHALPYAADGSAFPACSAAIDSCAAAAAPADGPARPVRNQASSASTASPPPRMQHRRRQ